VAGGDVGYVVPDPSSPTHVYAEAVSGNLTRVNLANGERVQIHKPNWELTYQKWEDSVAVLRGDPLKAPTRDVATAIAAIRTRQRQDSIDLDIRFGWEAAVLTSTHNPATLYWGGSRVLKSTDHGEHVTLISPDLTKKLYAKIDTSMHLTGGVSLETTQTELFGYTVALAESYVKPGLLYAGTDDGNVWMTHNDGGAWENVAGRFPGLPNPEAYVAHRRLAFRHADLLRGVRQPSEQRHKPYVYATLATAGRHSGRSPQPPMDRGLRPHVIREDPHNQNLVFVGRRPRRTCRPIAAAHGSGS
jgi:hypothetical protein